jgi:hypothetical protein
VEKQTIIKNEKRNPMETEETLKDGGGYWSHPEIFLAQAIFDSLFGTANAEVTKRRMWYGRMTMKKVGQECGQDKNAYCT